MAGASELAIRRANVADAEAIANLLDRFSREFDEFTPGPDPLANRIRRLLADDEATVLLSGSGPGGLRRAPRLQAPGSPLALGRP